MNSVEIQQLQEAFDKMTVVQKRNFIVESREQLKETNNEEYLKFLDKCIEDYNAAMVKEQKKQQILSKLTIILSSTAVLTAALLIYLIPKIKFNTVQIKEILELGSSTQITAGMILAKNDIEMEARDIIISHKSKKSTTILEIWDFAYEDGDAIQVFIDDEAITEEIKLLNEAIEIEVPTIGIVEVRGVIDGGGGITYAVYCELDETTYLNTAPIDGSNKYIFKRA